MNIELPTADEPVKVIHGDCRKVLAGSEGVFDAVVTDPPYEIGFMGKQWDKSGVAFDPATWAAILGAVKPAGYMMAFAGSRTQHRIACAIEDAGWEIRDCLLWLYGTGFPKGKGCLKPAYEPIILARRPGPKVLPLSVDECRVKTEESTRRTNASPKGWSGGWTGDKSEYQTGSDLGRWPANILHDGSEEVLEAFAAFGEKGGGFGTENRAEGTGIYGKFSGATKGKTVGLGDSGTAARFFYCAKASKSDRGEGNTHSTVKPTSLIEWLVRLVSKPGDTILDPFAGSGTTGKACAADGRKCVLIEEHAPHVEIIKKRLWPKGELFS